MMLDKKLSIYLILVALVLSQSCCLESSQEVSYRIRNNSSDTLTIKFGGYNTFYPAPDSVMLAPGEDFWAADGGFGKRLSWDCSSDFTQDSIEYRLSGGATLTKQLHLSSSWQKSSDMNLCDAQWTCSCIIEQKDIQ
ncbi:hypothetical protein GXP67_10735 [Rhodocytophaga rosea]|uniref:Uncharacterized protein n=1 Tax=Rhodocytophaga rosea TaxID=2704465 RepID=A0A6C0GHB1_9BACT|nr:hypothetical protein [Rhodocytophaga rosea]QHT67090.1 hypothetical protein GXP67_10735 [Rhodocytophaga rosea]